jgi:hypothetical protein
MYTVYWWLHMKETDHLEDVGIELSITVKQVLRK